MLYFLISRYAYKEWFIEKVNKVVHRPLYLGKPILLGGQ